MRKLFVCCWLFVVFLFVTYYILPATQPVYAVCPVCTVAVGAGLGLARYFGVDDTVSGVWIGGLILSSSFWLSDWLKKKDFAFIPKLYARRYTLFTTLIMYLVVILPLWFSKIIGHPFNTIFGIDKLIFGTAFGSLVFFLAVRADKLVRYIKGKQLFIYQKIVFPIVSLAIISGLFYLLIK